MELKQYDIWAEGFLDQGMEGVPEKASYVGKEYGINFADACERYYRKHSTPEDFNKYFFITDDGIPCYWVRLFDNEIDARKSFG